MTKQERIRDSVIVNIAKACPEMLNEKAVELADKILKDEAAQGVVIQGEDVINHYVSYTFEPLIGVEK